MIWTGAPRCHTTSASPSRPFPSCPEDTTRPLRGQRGIDSTSRPVRSWCCEGAGGGSLTPEGPVPAFGAYIAGDPLCLDARPVLGGRPRQCKRRPPPELVRDLVLSTRGLPPPCCLGELICFLVARHLLMSGYREDGHFVVSGVDPVAKSIITMAKRWPGSGSRSMVVVESTKTVYRGTLAWRWSKARSAW